ncbi:RNA polymerase II elongation factor Ell [Leptopilina boulardi]|uniref:RNA polymerase II elongation factor Ell n=1 Tax=Leptopilina boulardi TaxID=63433 RepID=UPI0021F56BFE|nr:RNA polymerase II elongation factor Ell [Leptopilina boulardi]
MIQVSLKETAEYKVSLIQEKNQLKQKPTIQFLGNEGQLSFPSSQSSHGTTNFTFSLSGSEDIEGSQGGFECIQQTGQKSLESLGALQCKMRIQANDDVYETTRHRMAVAEENNKNKCTRIIKPNGPDIGRKVKVKGTVRTTPLTTSTNVKQRESTSNSTSGINLSRFSSSSSSSSNSSSTTTTISSSSTSSYKSISRNPPSISRSKTDKQVPDIARTPIRERLIHLLALRPYKKPELYERINKEGVKDKDRSKMFEHLKEISFIRDNAYHLKRSNWNDVQDNWIHYSEQEKAILKRRKPQNLTPPGSSDGGSSGSGQSPSSVHPGSPPAITAPPPALLNSKRPGYYEGNDGLQTKKPRISHYRKPEPLFVNHGDNRRTTDGNYNNSGDSRVNSADHRFNNNNNNSADRVSDSVNSVESLGGNINNNINSSSNSGSSGSASCNSRSNLFAGETSNWSQRQQNRLNSAERTTNNEVLRNNNSSNNSGGGGQYATSVLCLSDSDSDDDQNHVQHPKNDERSSNSHVMNSSDQLRNVTYTNSQINYTESPMSPDPSNNVTNNASTQTANASNSHEEYPDYLTYYTKVSSDEQRRRYKEEFNNLYSEYRELYEFVNPVKSRYYKWQQQFNEVKAQGNLQELEIIKINILKDYNIMNNDPVFKQRNTRHDYLHGKLRHLKNLVEEYDAKHFGVNNSSTSSSNNKTTLHGKENQNY